MYHVWVACLPVAGMTQRLKIWVGKKWCSKRHLVFCGNMPPASAIPGVLYLYIDMGKVYRVLKTFWVHYYIIGVEE